MEINEAYEGARVALSEDDFVVAEQQFLRVWNHEKSHAETAAWAAFEATVAAFLDGRSGDAREHLANLEFFLVEVRPKQQSVGSGNSEAFKTQAFQARARPHIVVTHMLVRETQLSHQSRCAPVEDHFGA